MWLVLPSKYDVRNNGVMSWRDTEPYAAADNAVLNSDVVNSNRRLSLQARASTCCSSSQAIFSDVKLNKMLSYAAEIARVGGRSLRRLMSFSSPISVQIEHHTWVTSY